MSIGQGTSEPGTPRTPNGGSAPSRNGFSQEAIARWRERLQKRLTAVRRKLFRVVYRLTERVYEWRYGISSSTVIKLREFGINDASLHDYGAISYRRFFQLMKRIGFRPGEDVFLDFGSGMGRAVVLAATYPFRKVIGVELVPELDAVARENIRRAKWHFRCPDVELQNVDAKQFVIPPEATMFYFWNPFGGEILSTVFENIRQSVKTTPRTITILHLSPEEPTCLDQIRHRFEWLKERQRFTLGTASVSVNSCEFAGESAVNSIAPETRH